MMSGPAVRLVRIWGVGGRRWMSNKADDTAVSATMRARLVYQSRKRGTLENDLLLSTFAREYLDTMSTEEMEEYGRLLEEPDWDVFYWATGSRDVPARWKDSRVLRKLVEHANQKNVGRMPSLD